MQALGPDVQSVLGDNLSDLAYRRRDANGYLERITVAQGLEAIRQQVPGLDDPDAVKAAINRHVFDPVIAERNAFLCKVAWEQFYASHIEIWLRPQKSIELHSALATGTAIRCNGTAIRCNDTPSITDLAQWTAAVRSVAQQAPLHFGGLLDNHACAFWQRPQVQKPDVQALGGLDVLLVQAQYDAATPAEGGERLFYPPARRVQVPGDYQHGVYPYRDRCVDPLVTRYLLGEPPIQRDTACPAHALEMDARPPWALAQRQSTQSVQSGPANPAPSAYRNPQQAEMLIDAFKRGLQPRTRQGFEASRLKG